MMVNLAESYHQGWGGINFAIIPPGCFEPFIMKYDLLKYTNFHSRTLRNKQKDQKLFVDNFWAGQGWAGLGYIFYCKNFIRKYHETFVHEKNQSYTSNMSTN